MLKLLKKCRRKRNGKPVGSHGGNQSLSSILVTGRDQGLLAENGDEGSRDGIMASRDCDKVQRDVHVEVAAAVALLPTSIDGDCVPVAEEILVEATKGMYQQDVPNDTSRSEKIVKTKTTRTEKKLIEAGNLEDVMEIVEQDRDLLIQTFRGWSLLAFAIHYNKDIIAMYFLRACPDTIRRDDAEFARCMRLAKSRHWDYFAGEMEYIQSI